MTKSENDHVNEVRRAANDIKSLFPFENFKTKYDDVKNNLKSKLLDLQQQNLRLKKEIETIQENRKKLNKEKDNQMNINSQEDSELKRFDDELRERREEIENLKKSIQPKEKTVKELEIYCEAINKKIEFQEKTRKTKEDKYKRLAGIYRKATGLEIEAVKPNVIKIIYREMYFVVDFTLEKCIIDCVPTLFSLDTLNKRFSDCKSIYEFLIWLRSEFIKKNNYK